MNREEPDPVEQRGLDPDTRNTFEAFGLITLAMLFLIAAFFGIAWALGKVWEAFQGL